LVLGERRIDQRYTKGWQVMRPQSTANQEFQPGALEEFSTAECWRLVATQPVGRLAVIVGHYPMVFPVNYAVDDKTILYRTGVGAKLWSVHRSNVTFEVDQVDVFHRSGWSVMIMGVAEEINIERNRREISRAELAGARPWAPGVRDHFIRIHPDQITGRRIQPGELPLAGDLRGYL
jgi:nitroimidazol reductase NimA-like FMN-containing flavoprotein (pyridoxamine 5'-phosphate oxidase superfamily)